MAVLKDKSTGLNTSSDPFDMAWRRNKYGAKKTAYKGEIYDSKLEARCAADLDLLLAAGEIVSIERQVAFELIPKPNRIRYVADFVVKLPDGSSKIFEAKGVMTQVASMKLKLMRHFYPDIQIEIYAR